MLSSPPCHYRRLIAIAAALLLFLLLAACDSTGMSPAMPSPTPLSPYLRGVPIDGIRCDQLEQTAVHYHAHLAIYVDGQQVSIPTDVGRQTPNCYYWLHTHEIAGDDGVIHIEAPANLTFQLAQFFDIWGQQLSQTNLLGHPVDAAHPLTVYVYNPSQADIDAHNQAVQQAEQDSQDIPPFTVTPSGDLQPYTGDPGRFPSKPTN